MSYGVRIEDQPGVVHIRSAPGSRKDGTLTLCGWVDVAYQMTRATANCDLCAEIVAYCYGLTKRTKEGGTP